MRTRYVDPYQAQKEIVAAMSPSELRQSARRGREIPYLVHMGGEHAVDYLALIRRRRELVAKRKSSLQFRKSRDTLLRILSRPFNGQELIDRVKQVRGQQLNPHINRDQLDLIKSCVRLYGRNWVTWLDVFSTLDNHLHGTYYAYPRYWPRWVTEGAPPSVGAPPYIMSKTVDVELRKATLYVFGEGSRVMGYDMLGHFEELQKVLAKLA